MRGFIARRSSGALLVSIIALVMAMGGVGYAAGGLSKKQVKKVASNAASSYFNNHIGSASVANSRSLGGVAASGYSVRNCNSQTGAIKGWAAITGSGAFSPSFVPVQGYNCSGQGIQAKRLSQGVYEVQFLGSSATTMVGSANPVGFVDYHPGTISGDFIVGVQDESGTKTDESFTVLAP